MGSCLEQEGSGSGFSLLLDMYAAAGSRRSLPSTHLFQTALPPASSAIWCFLHTDLLAVLPHTFDVFLGELP